MVFASKLFMSGISLVCLMATMAGASWAQTPLKLNSGQMYMVLDPRLNGVPENCEMKVHQFTRHPKNPIIRPDRPYEVQGAYPRIILYGTALWDETQDQFRLWYTTGLGTCYAVSKDGINWEKPNVAPGDSSSNILSPGEWMPVVYIDNAAKSPDRKYVKWAYQTGPGSDGHKGDNCIYRFFSPDGLKWTRERTEPVIPGNPVHYLGGEAGDVVYTYWHQSLGKFVSYYKCNIPNPNPAPNDQPQNAIGLRQTIRFESTDGIKWSDPTWVFTRDEEDKKFDQYIQFYGTSIHPIGDLFVAFPWMYHCNEGTIEIGLAYSTDTVNWIRPFRDQMVLPLGKEGEWDSAMIMTSAHLIEKDGMWWLYYAGCPFPHKNDVKRYFSIGLAQMPVGRLVSARSWRKEGTWTTGPIRLAGPQLRVNASVFDRLTVKVLDESGKPIPGYESNMIRDNGIDLPVVWPEGKDLSALTGKDVRLRFELNDAEVFGFVNR